MRARLATWVLLGAVLWPSSAAAWDWFRSPNDHVEEGNEALAAGDAQAALEAYEAAARELPDRGDVQLNRGLALSQLGRMEEARQAFDLATRGKVDAEVRADAYYNLGRNFMAQADAQAEDGDLQGAQAQLRESRDALVSSLRHRPGFEDAAWNLELVQRRLVELEEEQRKQEQQEQQQQEQQQQQQQQPGDEGEQGEPSETDEQSESSDESQPADPSEEGEPSSDAPPPEPDGDQPAQPQDQNAEDAPQGDEQAKPEDAQAPQPPTADEPPTGEPSGAESQPQPTGEPQPAKPGDAADPLPQHVQQVLDALQDGEETMQRHQARTRAQQRPRKVEKDW